MEALEGEELRDAQFLDRKEVGSGQEVTRTRAGPSVT